MATSCSAGYCAGLVSKRKCEAHIEGMSSNCQNYGRVGSDVLARRRLGRD